MKVDHILQQPKWDRPIRKAWSQLNTACTYPMNSTGLNSLRVSWICASSTKQQYLYYSKSAHVWTRQNVAVSTGYNVHLLLLVMRPQRSKLYGAIFIIINIYYYLFFRRHSDPGLFPKRSGAICHGLTTVAYVSIGIDMFIYPLYWSDEGGVGWCRAV